MLKQIGFMIVIFGVTSNAARRFCDLPKCIGSGTGSVSQRLDQRGCSWILIVSQYYDKEDKENSIPPMANVKPERFVSDF
jgi:hypothetical protein